MDRSTQMNLEELPLWLAAKAGPTLDAAVALLRSERSLADDAQLPQDDPPGDTSSRNVVDLAAYRFRARFDVIGSVSDPASYRKATSQ